MVEIVSLRDRVTVIAPGQYQHLQGIIVEIITAPNDSHSALVRVRFGYDITALLSEKDVRKLSSLGH